MPPLLGTTLLAALLYVIVVGFLALRWLTRKYPRLRDRLTR